MVLSLFRKEFYSKRKEFAPGGSKFFPFRIELFFRRDFMSRKANTKTENCLSCTQWRKIYQVYQIPFIPIIVTSGAGLCGSVGCASDWRSGGREFDPHRVRQHSFVEIDHEIFSTVILSLLLNQKGQLSVSG